MTEAEDRELEREARALLQQARTPMAAPAEVKARAMRRLMLALPIVGGQGGGGETGAPPGPAPDAPAAPATGLGQALAARVPAWSALVSFVAGGAIAVMATRPAPAPGGGSPRAAATSSAQPSATVVAMAAPSALEPSGAIEIPTLSAIAPAAPIASPARSPAPSPPALGGNAGGLEAERALLDVARTAVGRGDGVSALRAAEEHARKFPRGVLAEEREAMTIQALRLLHRDDAARDRLERFRRRFPTSFIRPALEATDGGSP